MKLTPQTVNQRKLYEPQTFSSTYHASSLTLPLQKLQLASTPADAAQDMQDRQDGQDVQDDPQPRGANEVCPLKMSRKS